MTKISSLCVYCGSQTGTDSIHREAARRLGTLLAEHGIRLVYGGGGIGLMGVLADAVLAAGGAVTGVMPTHLSRAELRHETLTKTIIVDSMHARKQRMFEIADAFAILPGGLGTLDEAFEIITWKMLELHDKPILLIDNGGYWAPLRAMIDHAVAEGFASTDSVHLFTVVDDVDGVLPALEAAPSPALEPRPGRL